MGHLRRGSKLKVEHSWYLVNSFNKHKYHLDFVNDQQIQFRFFAYLFQIDLPRWTHRMYLWQLLHFAKLILHLKSQSNKDNLFQNFLFQFSLSMLITVILIIILIVILITAKYLIEFMQKIITLAMAFSVIVM